MAIPGVRWDWQPAIWVVAALTMLVGSIIAIVQADVKRMLAYSSIAHAGFILVGLLAMDRDGIGGVLFYLAAYGFTTIGAFALVALVRTATPEAASAVRRLTSASGRGWASARRCSPPPSRCSSWPSPESR